VRTGVCDLDLVPVETERLRRIPEERRSGTEPEDGVALSRFTHPGSCASTEITEKSNPPELRTLSFPLLFALALGR
jgi:hypothetical protein